METHLGVIFSFLSARELLHKSLFIVCKEWNRVLCELPHAWNSELDLRWPMHDIPLWSTFAWSRIKVVKCFEYLVVQMSFKESDKHQLGQLQGLTGSNFSTLTALSGLSITPEFRMFVTSGFNYRLIDADLSLLSMLHLTELNLSGCQHISNSGLAHLSMLPLKHLDLSEIYHLDESGLARLSSLRLQHLNLSHCKVTDAGLKHLSLMPLQHLDLTWSQLTDAGLAHLSSLPLKYLNLAYCSAVTDDGLAHISLMPLETLILYCCYQLTDAGLAHLSLMPLEDINIGCVQVSEAGLAHLNFSRLKFIRKS